MRRFLTLAIVAALAASTLLGAGGGPASAGGSFTFYGSGYGHGIGMSQWGAYGLARMGWPHSKIIRHFYQGVTVERPGDLPERVRIGLTSARTIVHLKAQVGPVKVWTDAPGGTLVGTIPAGHTWRVLVKDRAYAVKDHNDALVGGHRWGSPSSHLFVTYKNGARVFIPEADSIWFEGFPYARGSLEFNLYSCGDATGCAERLIARLDLEEYLFGLGEVPASWPMEALRAQAVAARAYAVHAIRKYGVRSDCNCHLTDGPSDQTYIGYKRELDTGGDRWVGAVRDTAGKVPTYDGQVIQAFYAASDGGHSENVEDVWHGGNDAYAIPWLTGVCDPGESTSANPHTNWSVTFDAAGVTSRLAPYTGSIGTVTSFRNIKRGVSGRIVTVDVMGTSGSAVVTGTEIRAALGLRDDRVWVNTNRNVLGSIRERYDSLMCAPGLPTSPTRYVPGGQEQLFAQGGLYRNGSKDLTVWIRGVIDDEYREVGTGGGVLGVPLAPVKTLGRALDCTDCRRADFERGRIYWKKGVGAHALWGRVLDAYLAEGGAIGSLGFPATRVRDMAAGGKKARFEQGRIACPKGEGCSVSLF